MSNSFRGSLYVGVTNDLIRRVYQHKEGMMEGFTKKYNLKKLVYYEIYEEILYAIQREKNIKFWDRNWKIELIERMNPEWRDLYEDF
jgi:putative endonuclease